MATPYSNQKPRNKADVFAEKFLRLSEEDRLKKHPNGEVLAELKAIRELLEKQQAQDK